MTIWRGDNPKTVLNSGQKISTDTAASNSVDELKLRLPELNPAQHTWLERYITSRIVKELDHVRVDYDGKAIYLDVRPGHATAITVDDRIAQLKKEAGGK